MMNIKSTDPTRSAAMHAPGFDFVPERSEAMLNLQKELLGTYEEASRAWLARVQSEVAL